MARFDLSAAFALVRSSASFARRAFFKREVLSSRACAIVSISSMTRFRAMSWDCTFVKALSACSRGLLYCVIIVPPARLTTSGNKKGQANA
ncbi:MAG: hypothetical protein ACXIVD_05915 [Salinarimonas sp.]